MSERFVKMSDASGDVFPKASYEVTFTLTAAGWEDPVSPETYYSQTVTGLSSLVTSTSTGILSLSQSISDAAYEAAADCQLRCTAQGSGTITVKAKEKPTVDIPCVIVLLG